MVNSGLKDRVAIITGANNPWGIGAATALAFARAGTKVVLIYKKSTAPLIPAKRTAMVWIVIMAQMRQMRTPWKPV